MAWAIICIHAVAVCTDAGVTTRWLFSLLWARAVPDGPVSDDRGAPLGSSVDESKMANEVLLPETVPPSLSNHGVEAWVEAPNLALVHPECHLKGIEIRRDGSLTAAHPRAGGTVGRAVDALTVGVAPSKVLALGIFVPTDEPKGVAADDHEVVARWGWEKGVLCTSYPVKSWVDVVFDVKQMWLMGPSTRISPRSSKISVTSTTALWSPTVGRGGLKVSLQVTIK